MTSTQLLSNITHYYLVNYSCSENEARRQEFKIIHECLYLHSNLHLKTRRKIFLLKIPVNLIQSITPSTNTGIINATIPSDMHYLRASRITVFITAIFIILYVHYIVQQYREDIKHLVQYSVAIDGMVKAIIVLP